MNNYICILEDHCLQWGEWTGGDEIRDLEARRTVGKLLPQALSYRRESADGKKQVGNGYEAEEEIQDIAQPF